MIEKLPFEITQSEYEGKKFDIKSPTSPFDMQVKINEIVDLLNAIVVDVDGTKCIDGSKSPAKNVQEDTESGPENVQDPYAEQHKWIGCLVRYKVVESCQGGWYVDVLDEIVDHPIYPFKMRNGDTAEVCELVTQDEIYPNKARTW